jgi:phage terminase large subunit GpA-like protein
MSEEEHKCETCVDYHKKSFESRCDACWNGEMWRKDPGIIIEELKQEIERLRTIIRMMEEARTLRVDVPESWLEDEESNDDFL